MIDSFRDDAGGRAMPPAGAGWGWMLAYGVLSVALGIAAFVWPFAATLTATWVVGAFFTVAGIVSIVAGIRGRGHDGRGYAIGFGIVSLLIGLVMVLEPVTGAFSLTLTVTAWLAARGVMEIAFGTRMRRGKAMMIGLGVVNIVLAGIVLATLPFSALTLPGYILAISFLFGGVQAIAAALAHRQGAPAFSVA
jgi:uncharacterized membrane protein HdeD (DUF308 family)